MINELKKAFSIQDLERCLGAFIANQFYIYDTDEKCCVAHTEADSTVHFTVDNPTERQLYFLAIDRGILPDTLAVKRCDCAVFDHKTFCFIEIKIVDSTLQRTEANRKAKEQLKSTILLFQEKLTFTTRRVEAYVCVGRTIARPARRATDLNEIVEFEDELGVALFHGNEKRFA